MPTRLTRSETEPSAPVARRQSRWFLRSARVAAASLLLTGTGLGGWVLFTFPHYPEPFAERIHAADVLQAIFMAAVGLGLVLAAVWPLQRLQSLPGNALLVLVAGLGFLFISTVLGTVQDFVASQAGSPIHVLEQAARLAGAAAIVSAVALWLRDLLRVRDRLLIEEERLALAAESAELGIWDFDFASGRLDWDEGMFSLYGVDPADFGERFEDWSNAILPEARDEVFQQFEATVASGNTLELEFPIQRANDGAVRTLHCQAQIIRDSDGAPRRVVGVNRDITELKQAQQASQRALEQLAWERTERVKEGHCLRTITRILHNDAHSDGELLDTVVRSIPCGFTAPKDTCARIRMGDHDYKTVPFQESPWSIRVELELPEQVSGDLTVYRLDPLSADARRKVFISEEHQLLTDIAQQISLAIGRRFAQRSLQTAKSDADRATREAERAREEAERASHTKSEFLANMSHEIRTPMNAVIGLSQLLQHTTLDRRQQDYLNKILHASRMLLGILNDILDFSKIESGNLELEERDFALNEIVEQMATLFDGKAHARQIEFLYNIQPDLPHSVVGDSLRLSQVLTNLLSNAFKFTEANGVVELGVHAVEPASDHTITLRFSVRDNGIGMTEQQVNRLFRAFSQADSSTTRRFGGTGLGLVISQRLVEKMGGRLTVTSEPGAGSTFSFTLTFPIGKDVRPAIECPRTRGRRVLVVDDHEDARNVIRDLLTHCRFITEEAISGEAAVDAVLAAEKRGEPFDFILMDWMMPGGMNGSETCREIERLRKAGALQQTRPPLLMVSAYQKDEVELPEELVSEFLPKPIAPLTLYDALVRAESGLGITHKPAPDPASAPTMTGRDLLLVEDNEINQEVARLLLEVTGAKVRLANNGAEALDAVRGRAPDLILMDLQMPVMDGFEATRQLRKAGYARPIVALSAAVMDDDRERSRAAGMDAHLGKPIDSEEIYAMLEEHLGGSAPAGPPSPDASDDAEVTGGASTDRDSLPADLPGFNLALGRRQLAGNDALYVRQLRRFRTQLRSEFTPLIEHLRAGRAEPAQRLAHTLKGTAGTLAAVDLQRYAAQIDAAFKQGQAVDENLTASLQHAIQRAEEALAVLDAAPSDTAVRSIGGRQAAVEALRGHLENSEWVEDAILQDALAYLRGRGLDCDALEADVERMAFDDALRELNALIKPAQGPTT